MTSDQVKVEGFGCFPMELCLPLLSRYDISLSAPTKELRNCGPVCRREECNENLTGSSGKPLLLWSLYFDGREMRCFCHIWFAYALGCRAEAVLWAIIRLISTFLVPQYPTENNRMEMAHRRNQNGKWDYLLSAETHFLLINHRRLQ